MKVGGNESATKYFQTHGGSAALASKDPKTKYTSNAATKYKEELSRRVVADAKLYPEEVIITDADAESAEGTNTPAGEPDDDFFSSWDKPTIKRPSNPPSRVGTPSGNSRTASPFLAPANGSGTARPKSPLSAAESAAPAAPRTTTSSAIRKTAAAGTARKTNILGAKKKLGAKKVTAADDLDFEEAERIEKLGYDPNEGKPAESSNSKSASDSNILSPTPISPSRGGFGATKSTEKSGADVERLGMGVARLGFGQTGSAAKPAPKKAAGGFGSTSRAAQGISHQCLALYCSIC